MTNVAAVNISIPPKPRLTLPTAKPERAAPLVKPLSPVRPTTETSQ